MSSESELLGHIYARSADLAARFPIVLAGPGDDCAGLRSEALGAVTLAKIDQLVEGRHYDPATTPIDLVARKAICRAISDIAAMGGRPLAALVGAALRDGFAYEHALFDAMRRCAESFDCPLVGGDIARVAGPTVLSVAVLGAAHPSRGFVGRRGARPGDGVYVSGRLGNSLASGRHLTFEPRLREGAWLCDTLGQRLTAMMDISDGLGRDAGRLSAASGVRISLDAARIPRHDDCPDWRSAASDGEDYELLFTASGSAPIACPTGVPITRVGAVSEGEGCVIAAPDGSTLDAAAMGWEHGS